MPIKTSVLVTEALIGLVLLVLSADALMAKDGLPPGARADVVLIDKSGHTLTLLAKGKVLHSYLVALGHGGLAPKTQEGDGRTPEGRYKIDSRLEHSTFHRALHISYPSPADVARAKMLGVKPGGAIMIHGLRNGMGWIGARHRNIDWTNGCIAVTDDEIDEIWRAVPNGTTVEIRR
jgi:murein L,D-transpeptidase YafK